jgi:curved DNA-binding protein CbpA
MRELSEAYTVLSDDRARREYDASLEPVSRFHQSPSTSAASSTSHHYRSTYSDNLRRRQTANYAWSHPKRPPPSSSPHTYPSSRASQQRRPPGDTPLYYSFTQEAERQAKRASRASQRMDQRGRDHVEDEKKFRRASASLRFAGILSMLAAVSMLTHMIRAGLS